MQDKKNKSYALSSPRKGSRDLANELQTTGLFLVLIFPFLCLGLEKRRLVITDPSKGSGSSQSILFSHLTLERCLFSSCPVTIWAQIHHHVATEVKKMLLKFSCSSWLPSVPMWYRENSNHVWRIFPKRVLYNGKDDSEQRLSLMTQPKA